jgi:hypothetical protein
LNTNGQESNGQRRSGIYNRIAQDDIELAHVELWAAMSTMIMIAELYRPLRNVETMQKRIDQHNIYHARDLGMYTRKEAVDRRKRNGWEAEQS